MSRHRDMSSHNASPWISLVVPARNRPEQLRIFLESALRQEKPPFEVLVVLNDATPAVCELADSFTRNTPCVRVLHRGQANASAARNLGWRAAQAPLIAFIDDDARLPADWLKQVLAFTRRWPDVEVFGGPYRRYTPQEPPAWFPPEYGNGGNFQDERQLGNTEWLDGTNMIFKRPILERLNGFSEDLGPRNGVMRYGEETNLFKRLHEMNVPCYTSPKLVVEHALLPYKLSLRWLVKSDYVCGYSHVTALKREINLGRSTMVLIKAFGNGVRRFFSEREPLKRNIYLSFRGFFYQLGVVAGMLTHLLRSS